MSTTNYDDSGSSSDEDISRGPKHPMFHVQLPTTKLNLEEVRRQNHMKHEKPTIVKTTASNFAKAKKITTGSNKNFGKPIPSNSKTTNPEFRKSFIPQSGSNVNVINEVDSDQDNYNNDDDDDEFKIETEKDKRMKNFTFNSAKPLPFDDNNKYYQFNEDDYESEDVEDETNVDFSNLYHNPPQEFYHTDSSEDDDEDDDNDNNNVKEIHRSTSNARRSQSNHEDNEDPLHSEFKDQVSPIKSRSSIHSLMSGTSSSKKSISGASLTRKSISGSSLTRKSVSGTTGIKGILRKMSMVDRYPNDSVNQDISHNDTFLGKVLHFGSSNNQSISGGGLGPGASKVRNDNDEEKRVGFEDTTNDDNSIEMQPLNVNDLSEEAKDLINQHLPGLTHSATPSAEITPNESPRNLRSPIPEEEGDDEKQENDNHETNKKDKNKDSQFYTPNPDLFIRGSEDVDSPNIEAEADFMNIDSLDYIAPPKHVQSGVLSSLLRLYQNPQDDKSLSSLSRTNTGMSSYDEAFQDYDASSSMVDLNKFTLDLKEAPKVMLNKAGKFLRNPYHLRSDPMETKESSSNLDEIDEKYDDKDSDFEDGDGDGDGSEGIDGLGQLPSFQNAKPKVPKKKAPDPVYKLKKLRHNKRKAERIRITVHIADILQRQRFIMNMCRALMLFGAPTHRLEEYMIMTSRVLEIDGQFIYFPGCMLISFGDAATRTSEVHLVRCAQGLNLSKLADTHRIYKSVIHDLIGVEEASKKLDDLLKSKNRYPPWLCVLIHGLGSGVVTVWAFDGGWLDIPICFGIGSCVGYLLYYVSPMSTLYSSVFEVSSAIVVSFIGRGIASVRVNKDLFCFSAITQGSLAIILPGYIILCGSLELQSRNLVAGAVRMFYAIIYSLFLGFGITLGAALYGWIDHNATSDNSCEPGHNIDDKWRILFVPLYAALLGLLNQARWSELPVMVIIAGIGYIGTYFAGKHFSQVTEFTACIGAFIIGVLGNMYSRIWKGLAVSAMLPAIFVQVPSGIASKSTLISGLQTADQITNKNGTTSSTTGNSLSDSSSLSFGASMVEVSIGISVGLFAAAIIVYPFGKKRTGLFAL